MNLAAPSSPAPDSLQVPDDLVLLGRASLGDSSAFAALFERHYPAIHAFGYRLSLCPAEADDIAQETFVQAARALATFRGDSSFKNWLYTIATNKSRDRFRQRARHARLGEQLSALGAGDDPPASLATAAAHASDSAATRAHAAVRDALADLSPELREAVALVYYEGLNHAEAARVLGCAESTVSWRIFRAKHKLKKALRSGAAAARHD